VENQIKLVDEIQDGTGEQKAKRKLKKRKTSEKEKKNKYTKGTKDKRRKTMINK
jgi:hypothetical protein